MAYDETLAARVRRATGHLADTNERKMFGGLCFLVNGNMLVGVSGDRLMARVGKDAYDEALRQPHCRPMDFTGRPMAGFVYVEREGLADDAALGDWIARAHAYVGTLPAK